MSKQSKRHMGAEIKSAEGRVAITVADDGKVGIGTQFPGDALLDVKGADGVKIRHEDCTLELLGRGDLGYAIIGTDTDHDLIFRTNNIPHMSVDTAGICILGGRQLLGYSKLRAGSNTPAFAWRNNIDYNYSTFIVQRSQAAAGSQVYQLFEAGVTDIGVSGVTVGGIRRNSGNTAFEFYNPSDERLKNVKGEFSAALEKVEGIPVKWYSWKTNPDQEHFRFIAQDVQKHIPSAVFEDEEGHLQLGESDMFPVLWQAVRELKAELDEAKAEIAALRKQP